MKRSDFLKLTALTGAALTTAMTPASRATGRAVGKARNIIFMVSDGMSAGTLTMADLHIRMREGRASRWIGMYESGRAKRSLMDMASLNSVVTDSSAAASSWGCGHRIVNNAVNMGPNGEVYPPLLPLFRRAGKATGLVTTTRITHATPAGFIANVRSRAMEDPIAVQQFERRPDLLLGGGGRHFDPATRRDGRDLFGEFAGAGYHVVKTRQDLLALGNDGKPLVGLFHNNSLPYTTDHLNIPEYRENIPTLAEMTRVALDRLGRHPDGFIVQIEGARIDHAAHGNDAAGLLMDQVAFDEAVGVVLEWTADRDDTLVIVTSDHGNANPGLNGEGSNYGDSAANLAKVAAITRTNEWIRDQWSEETTTVDIIREDMARYTGFEITQAQAEAVGRAAMGVNEAIYRKMGGISGVMGQVIAAHTGVNFIGDSHTADYVELASFGPGSERLGGFVRNTDLFELVLGAAGVSVRTLD